MSKRNDNDRRGPDAAKAGPGGGAKAARPQRLGQALRANLQRRKIQQRRRAAPPASGAKQPGE